VEAFYRDLARTLFVAGYLDLQVMYVGEQIAALNFGAKYGDRYYYIIPTFDEAFGCYSVGRLLLLHLLEQSFEEKMSEFDMLLGNEAYKAEFATNTRELFSFSIYQPTLKGLLAYWWFAQVRRRLRHSRQAQRLVPWLRRAGILRRFS